MNYDSYLARAIEIFNDKMDADFSRDHVILASVYKGILHKTTKYGLPTY